MPDRPNVLLLCTDQQFAGAMSCMGNDDLETPAMDSIYENGVAFENAYCTDPVCTPSRTSMITGRMPHETGVTEFSTAIPERYRDQELGALFDAAGYDCGYGGKWHVGDGGLDLPEGHGFERIAPYDDHVLADGAIDFLDRDREDPFLLVASYDNPHDIGPWGRNNTLHWGSVPETPVEECPDLPKNFAPPPFEPGTIRRSIENGDARIKQKWLDATPEEWREYRNAYYRLVERADAGIGRILDALRERGLEEETVVLFTSDHGEGHGAHRLAQKQLLYEEMVRVPFVVSYPGETDTARTDDHLVSNGLDLVPTLCDYAGIDPPEDLRGRSVRPLAAGESVPEWRDYVVTQSHGPPNEIVEGRMVRSDRYKYVVYDGDRGEQLFDIEDDPGEMVDLSENAAYQSVLDDHRERLLEWCMETGDIFGESYSHPGVPSIPGYEYREIRDLFEGGAD